MCFFTGDPTLKHALLENQDISPESDHNLSLVIEESGLLDQQFEHLEPPLEEDYLFSLEQGEGISELFDIMSDSYNGCFLN